MSDGRRYCLHRLETDTGCKVVLVTNNELPKYILPEEPLHPIYPFLSETHKADYLRTYFMHFHGGGYSDIKMPAGSWTAAFEQMRANENYWICGYKEIEHGVAYLPYADLHEDLVGNCCYICRPRTPFTAEWYGDMVKLLDSKLELAVRYPATFPQDRAEVESGYPIEWNEMLGRIFHRVLYGYRDHMLNTLPEPLFCKYR